MAIATLELGCAGVEVNDDECAYAVRTELFEPLPYSGPAGTNVCRFDAKAGSYEWRTLSDHLRDLAQAFVAGDVTEREALAGHLGDWLTLTVERLAEREDGSELELVARVLRGIADDSIDTTDSDGPFRAYDLDDDVAMRDAANALPLPPWARLESCSDGGPGSGYEQPCLILSEHKQLEDYQAWLEALAIGDER